MIIVMRGASCSGKSAFIDQNFGDISKNHIFSSDDFREMLCGSRTEQNNNKLVFETMNNIVETRLINRVPLTVVDATHLRFKDCQSIVDLGKKYHTLVMVISIIPPELSRLKKRNEIRNKFTGFYVPETVLEKHHNRYTASIDPFIKEAMYNEYFKFTEVDQDYNVIRVVDGVDV
jgi:predicted kinase